MKRWLDLHTIPPLLKGKTRHVRIRQRVGSSSLVPIRGTGLFSRTMSSEGHPERLAREETIFHAALLFPDLAKRAAFLDLACEGNLTLRARIDRLLTLEPKADVWLEPPFRKPLSTRQQFFLRARPPPCRVRRR
ncbi:MAG TPA: hypothetical protein DCE44_24175 [Verrucomicrobiales bacterium]|nr:hypothetical protein [Verrucomicrobiales bacterium]